VREDQEILRAHSECVLFDLSERFTILSVSGADRLAFLQSITTNDVNSLLPGQIQHNAILDIKSHVRAEFWIIAQQEEILLFTDAFQVLSILEILESYHFSEQVFFENQKKTILAIQGPQALACVQPYTGDASILLISKSYTGDPGFLLICQNTDKEKWLQTFQTSSSPISPYPCSLETFEILRIEAGIPFFKQEMDEEIMLLELNLDEEILSLNKGCFPGQEIVARTKSRGGVQKRLWGLKTKENISIPLRSAILYEGKDAGQVRSTCWSPTMQATLILAFLRKTLQFADQEFKLQIGDHWVNAVVCVLPFYFPKELQEQASQEYEIALKKYHAGLFLEAKTHFKNALTAKPNYALALEGLAVTLEKLDEKDEAIVLNKRLSEMDPNNVMAHTNLSRLYLTKGLKDKAEEEKAKATAIGLRLSSKKAGHSVELLITQEAEKKKAEMERRKNIFEQVLAMDSEDEVANFGIGKIYLESGAFAQAISHLNLVIEKNPKYSAAYVLLGKALQNHGDPERARLIFTKGIEIAKNQGDLMPMKEMEGHLLS
jgi:folate-binding protein YgfZ